MANQDLTEREWCNEQRMLYPRLKNSTDDEVMEYEERAAIMEYDGNLARFKAERLARELTESRRENG